MGEIEFLAQLINSMSEAVDKLEHARNSRDSKEEEKIKEFILDLHKKIDEELR